MLRRTFLKVIGATVAALSFPIFSEATPKEKLPAALCPVCGSENITVKDRTMVCHECEAEGTLMVTLKCDSWPEIKE